MEAGTQPQQQEGRAEERDAHLGTVEEVQGVVVEVVFPGDLPEINHALEIELDSSDGDGKRRLVLEVQQQLGDDRVRAVAMDSTDGLSRGTRVRDTGGPITVPVGGARSAASSTCSANRSTRRVMSRSSSAGRSTGRRPASRT